MKLGPLDVPALPPLALPRLPLAAFRRRLVFHGAFVLLALATLALAVTLLTEERQRSRERYEAGFHQRLSSISAQLRHPTGQLALINAHAPVLVNGDITPVVLPFSALDFGDPFKARQAVEMSGCALRWPDGHQLCVAVGSQAYAGAFLYLVADLVLPPGTPRKRGQTDLLPVSRARVTLTVDGKSHEWVAPFEAGRGDPATLAAKMAEQLARRDATQPVQERSAGSTFRNPAGYSSTGRADDTHDRKAWAVIDAAGMRGARRGGAVMSEKHSNFLVNSGGATAADLEGLGEEVRKKVLQDSGILLEWEIMRVGEPAPK